MKKEKNYFKIAKYILNLSKKAYKKCSKQKLEIKDKGPHDLLTSLDTSLENFLIKNLNKDFPDVKIVSEEYNSKVEAKGTYFSIDPVDGTVNFANGLQDFWGIQIAYVENDIIVASSIFFPFKKLSYFAAKGFGAYKNGTKFVCEKKLPLYSLISIDTKDMDFYAKALVSLSPKILKPRHVGASCSNFVYMAEGIYGAMIQYAGNPWDIEPGLLLVEEANCLLQKISNYYVIATCPETLNLLVSFINSVYKTTL